MDTNGDGRANAWAIDTTGDGRVDQIVTPPSSSATHTGTGGMVGKKSSMKTSHSGAQSGPGSTKSGSGSGRLHRSHSIESEASAGGGSSSGRIHRSHSIEAGGIETHTPGRSGPGSGSGRKLSQPVAMDTTGDGVADAWGYDINGNGKIDGIDTNGDGKIDKWKKKTPPKKIVKKHH